MSAADVNVFVAARGNGFMTDIASWIVEAAAIEGRTARLVHDRLPAPDGSTNLVVAPHEFYVLRDDSDREVRAAARCSVPVCTEQPGTPWFNLSLGFCVGSPLVVDINGTGAAAIAAEGFAAHRLRLGAVPSMDRAGDDGASGRDIDVLFLGGVTDRRSRILAGLAPELWERRAELRLFRFARPIEGGEPGVVFGADKYDLLARSKVLVNLHRSDDSNGYFEWARMVETMANRCAVLTEPSSGCAPLQPGVHFAEAAPDDLLPTLIELLDDDARRAALSDAAHAAVMQDHPLAPAVAELLERADEALASPASPPWSKRLAARRSIVRTHRPPLFGEFRPNGDLRRRLYGALTAEGQHRRAVGRLRSLVEHGVEDHVERVETPAYAAAQPEVSVIVTLHDYADLVVETLESILASTDVALDVVVVDDHSRDASRDVVRTFMDGVPDAPILLLGSDVNRGLPAARNLAIAATRADRVMVMDADNLLYPTCLRLLSDALDGDPAASFAYATLEAFGASPGLRSESGWHVPWLCDANYIDAQALIRRAALDRHGGYRSDADVPFGWEDWDLWLRFAVAGEHGVHVAQMLGRYRTQGASMIATTNLFAPELRAMLVEQYPSLPWPEHGSP